MLDLFKAMLQSPQGMMAAWVLCGIAAVFTALVCAAALVALLHPDPKRRAEAKALLKLLLAIFTFKVGK